MEKKENNTKDAYLESEHAILQQAEKRFHQGNFRLAKPLYLQIQNGTHLKKEDLKLIQSRIQAINPDKYELIYGITSVLIILAAYIGSKFFVF